MIKFSYTVALQCKSYTCTKGYSYEDYFKVTGGHKTPGIKFEMHIAIKAENNGHILLASSKYLRTNDPVYEISMFRSAYPILDFLMCIKFIFN